MGDCVTSETVVETEEDLIALAQHILKALESRRNLTDNARKILANLGEQLSSLDSINESENDGYKEDKGLGEIEQQLNDIQERVMSWEKNQSMIWDCGPEETSGYLRAVDAARKLADVLENRNLGSGTDDENGFLRRAHYVLQIAMTKLEEEFKHLMIQNRQPLELEHMSFRSTEEDIVEYGSIMSSRDNSIDDLLSLQRDSLSRSSEEHMLGLVHPDVIPDLKSIANLMFGSNYGMECSQAFIDVQKDALDDFLFILDVEKLSIEDVMKMDWTLLNSKIKRWIGAMKVSVRVYLPSEKLLSDQIFGDLDSVSSVCFVESSKTAILRLLNFAEAIAIGPHQPEKLSRILDMHELLADLIPDITALYSDELGSAIVNEFHDILTRMTHCAKSAFLSFENAVASNVSANNVPGGGLHPLTRYVMNYLKTLADYSKTLDNIFSDQDRDGAVLVSVSAEMSPVRENDDDSHSRRTSYISPTAHHFRSLISILESNLDNKSKLYKDESLQHIFLTNNIHYMVEKVKGSELSIMLGDDWIRKHNRKFQQHAMSYERATWSSILALLRDEGIQHPGTTSISRTILKDRLQSFYLSFEEVYKSQTGWLVLSNQLREDLRISTSLKVIQAYRSFVGRHTHNISEKYIKYTADDLEDFLLDLFNGSQKSLHGGHKK